MRINPEALRRIREKSGHTQVSLSEQSGVAQTRISRLEIADPPAGIRPTTAKRLADALGVDIEAIALIEPDDEATEVAS